MVIISFYKMRALHSCASYFLVLDWTKLVLQESPMVMAENLLYLPKINRLIVPSTFFLFYNQGWGMGAA